MQFANNPPLEALVGRVCLVFAQVEHEAGRVVASSQGDWSEGMSTGYLEFSADSGLLLDWLKNVGFAYPEVKDGVVALRTDLRELKTKRDTWAHSAAIIDLFLLMKERGVTSMSDNEVGPGQLLSSRKAGHIPPPNQADVDRFCVRASEVGDAASALAVRVAMLSQETVRPVSLPRRLARQQAAASAGVGVVDALPTDGLRDAAAEIEHGLPDGLQCVNDDDVDS